MPRVPNVPPTKEINEIYCKPTCLPFTCKISSINKINLNEIKKYDYYTDPVHTPGM